VVVIEERLFMNFWTNKRKWVLMLSLLIAWTQSYSQLTQRIRGTVIDGILQKPIAGATVLLPSQNRSVRTDSAGAFRFTEVPVGIQQLFITHVGFKEIYLDNMNVNAGKEVVLTVTMENLIRSENEVIVKANSKKNKPLNDMSVVSARAFSVEETQKYAAAVNDPLRMATGFPGVLAAEDGNNDIIIRGNAPTGLLWRMEGVDIPNPNHFAIAAGTGGGISILSAQLLSNSDFVTGAFASEYGNALSGVFDLKLRKGNNEKREYTLQAGVLGLNAAAEGPIMPFYKGSYLVNYRYSTLGLLDKMGVVKLNGSTVFQDLSYNVYLPTKRMGTFSFFGFGGLSSDRQVAKKDSVKWTSEDDRYDSKFRSNTALSALTHNISLGTKTNLRSSVAFSYNANGDDVHYVEDDLAWNKVYQDDYTTKKWNIASTLNHKFSNKTSLRTGATVNFIQFDYYQQSKDNPDAPLKEDMNTKASTQTVQAFAQLQYKASDNLAFNFGGHYLRLFYNNTWSVEPRASVKWDVNSRNSIAFGYGLHSQAQGWGIYFAEENHNGQITRSNKNLDFTKSQHFVLSHNLLLAKNLRLKTEVYYQELFDVPVSASDTNTQSTLNILNNYIADPFVNKGKGRNYGVEISLEKYLSNHFYYMFSNSFYQSKYTALDGVERNTRFNGNHISTLLAGKDFISSSKSKTVGINIKTIYAGGLRTTPIDLEQSRLKDYTVFKQKEAYSLQNPAYFRTDLRLSIKWNRSKRTNTLSLDLQNLSNRLNVYNEYFDKDKGKVVYSYQNGLIPILNYKVEF
jgi:hypothetical protein